MEAFAMIFMWAGVCLVASIVFLVLSLTTRRRERSVRRVRVPAIVIGEDFSADGAIDAGM